MDRCLHWYTSTIIEGEERTNYAMPMLKVGFRQYNPEGDREDAMGRYFGFYDKIDEHIGAFTVRIQKP